MRGRVIILGSLILIAVAGCGKKMPGEIARVDGVVITEQDLKNALGPFKRNPSESEIKAALNRLIDQARYIAEAKRRGIDKSPEFLRQIEEYRKRLLQQMLIRKVSQEQAENTKITEERLRKFYENNKHLYQARKTFVVNHVKVAERSLAEKLYKEYKKVGDLRKAAREFMKNKPGKVTLIEREYVELPAKNYGPEFTKTLEKLKNGDVSGVINGTDAMYHIVHVIMRRDVPERTFDQVKDRIRFRLLGEIRNQGIRDFREELIKKYKANVNEVALNAFIKKYTSRKEEKVPPKGGRVTPVPEKKTGQPEK